MTTIVYTNEPDPPQTSYLSPPLRVLSDPDPDPDPGPLPERLLPHLPLRIIEARIAALAAEHALHMRSARRSYTAAGAMPPGSTREWELNEAAKQDVEQAELLDDELRLLRRHLTRRATLEESRR